jgi:glycosyltransferase involved in cell wall biosynthesis
VTRLVVFSDKLFRRTTDGLQTTGGFTTQIDALAAYFDQLTLCVPVVEDPSFAGASLTSPRICVWSLPAYCHKFDFARHLFDYAGHIRSAISQSDVVLCFIPGYIGVLSSWLAQRSHVPIFQYVVTDWALRFRVRTDSKIRLALSLVISPFLDWIMVRLTRSTLTFFNGAIPYDEDSRLYFTRVSSSLTRDSLFQRNDTCLAAPYRLLYVGRLSGEKGISYLLEATAHLQKQGILVSLDIVGEGPAREMLEQQADELDIGDLVRLPGFVARGPRLDEFYRAADIFVLPSLEDKQPKVLLEAMANSLPVVASRVGGIPTHVRNEQTGLLFTPRNTRELSDAIERLIREPGLRQHLIKKGLEYARLHTVETETAKTMQIVTDHFNLGELSDDKDP